MMKVVLKLGIHDDKVKQKAMKTVSGLPGVDSVAVDMKEEKLTLIGDIDTITVVNKLRKVCHTEVFSVGPAKEPEKKKEPEPKKSEGPGPQKPQLAYMNVPQFPAAYYYQYPNNYRSVEEDPNACVIC